MAGASVRITDNRKLEQHILAQLKRLRSSVVTVGVHGTGESGRDEKNRSVTVKQHVEEGSPPIDMPMLAAIHEFGTDKIPERSFIRAGVDSAHKTFQRVYDEGMDAIAAGTGTAQKVANSIGVAATSAIKMTMFDGIAPELAPATKLARIRSTKKGRKLNGDALAKEQAGTFKPLLHTGQLAASIAYEVKGAS